MSAIRECVDDDFPAILAIINAAAEAYRGAIPPDRWHDPYMSGDELRAELTAGVAFSGYETDGGLRGVMGLQPVRDATLLKTYWTIPERQIETSVVLASPPLDDL